MSQYIKDDIVLVTIKGDRFIGKVVEINQNECYADFIQSEENHKVLSECRMFVTDENSEFLSRVHPTSCILTPYKS